MKARFSLAALKAAINEFAAWRGSLTGHDGTVASMADEDERLTIFDAAVARARASANAAELMVKFIKRPCPHNCRDGNCPYDRAKREFLNRIGVRS